MKGFSPMQDSYLLRNTNKFHLLGNIERSTFFRKIARSPQSLHGKLDSDNEDTEEKSPNGQANLKEEKKEVNYSIEDTQVLFYDICLLLNLSLSVSVWVIHRDDPVSHLASAFSEGSLLSIIWVGVGVLNGLFLYSAVEGHQGSTNALGDNDKNLRGGPRAAGLLSLNTFVSVCSLRIIFALIQAVLGHRHVGDIDGELLIPLELACGLVLMSSWRVLHSSYVLR